MNLKRFGALARVFLALTFFLALNPHVFGAAVPRFAFVTNANDNTVSIYTVNAISGLLRDDGYTLEIETE